MRYSPWSGMLTAFALFCLTYPSLSSAQLEVSYNAHGVERLTYQGVLLEDTNQFKEDGFHIWHMKVTDPTGRPLVTDGWGESNLGTSWDAATKSLTYSFRWGSIRTQFIQRDASLDIAVTETNRPNSGVILAGAAIYPLALHFPTRPRGFENATYPQGGSNSAAPAITEAVYWAAKMVLVSDDTAKPLYSMLWPGKGGIATYSVLISSTPPDGLATFLPHHDRPVLPGQTDSFRVSLRFAATGAPLHVIAADAYANWTKRWPMQLDWKDRRVIGTAFLASSPSAGETLHGGSAGNPRRYFQASAGGGFDLGTKEGVSLFQARVLQRARDIVQNLRRLNAQGVITWDIEGEEYPQETSYVCAPDQVAQEAPEMDAIIKDSGSPYNGKKLDDAYFGIIKSAGYRVGVCVRPQRFVKSADGTARQTFLPSQEAEAEMLRKIRYAHDRWGATLFYLDSTVDQNGAPLDAKIFRKLASAFPDSLLIPEESTPKHYAYTAPMKSFLFHQDLGTSPDIHTYYPNAFSCNLINDAASSKLTASMSSLIASVAAGDILMARADYWDVNNTTVTEIYTRATRDKARH